LHKIKLTLTRVSGFSERVTTERISYRSVINNDGEKQACRLTDRVSVLEGDCDDDDNGSE